ncbi:MAG TPA: DUF4166 domain-containing protein [Aliidongia sp.]|uniref:DUF4166 domain-containing protein n=1 Tax=Aliidongia sp. TaxID=1914230 RepID=UPI002DDCF5CE|nr:DUF4166 domain-containing protein [Aliidongia sp.]HEV2673943.1 DUF4166 domain-containing protein [Aliidongia sp.]
MNRRIILVGGAGSFGRRLADALIVSTDFHIVLAGRHPECASIPAADPGRWSAVRLDRRDVTAGQLRALEGFLVIDAAGPFQASDLTLARAAIEAGLHYLDLADARDFVAAFPALDDAARAAGVVALTGASSTPALSNAVLDHLTAGWTVVETVDIAISPGNRAPRGLSVVAAILSYAGRPVRLFRNGRWGTAAGWGLLTRQEIPGVGRRLLSLCETPDLDILPARFAVRQRAIFRAGLELPILHLGLVAASLLVRARLVPSLVPFAGLFRALADLFILFGSDRGGMIVAVVGLDAGGAPVGARWSLVAEGGDGPVVPVLPCLAAVRALGDGRLVHPGAMACVSVLPLDWIEAEFRPYRLSTRIERTRPNDPLFARVSGDRFSSLPAPIRALHSPTGRNVHAGRAGIGGASNLVGRILARLLGFPPAGRDVAATVVIERQEGGERWTRVFEGRRFVSHLSPACSVGVIRERFGPLTFDCTVLIEGEALSMTADQWRFGPLRLPRRLMPRATGRETIDDQGRFRFDVSIDLPWIGQIVRYSGWLGPVAGQDVP